MVPSTSFCSLAAGVDGILASRVGGVTFRTLSRVDISALCTREATRASCC